MKIRPIEIADVACCQEIVRANWDEAAGRRFAAEVSQVWALDMENPPQFFVVEVQGRVLGFAGMVRSMLMQGVWDFTYLAVDPNFHGNGIGAVLVTHRLREAERQGATVIHLMTQKPDYFARWGFQFLRRYDGEGWCLLSRPIGSVRL